MAESEGCARVHPVPAPTGAFGGTNRSRRFVEPGLPIISALSSVQNKKAPHFCEALLICMAESEGFEPPEGLTLRLISSQVHSTGLCQLSLKCGYLNEKILTVKPKLIYGSLNGCQIVNLLILHTTMTHTPLLQTIFDRKRLKSGTKTHTKTLNNSLPFRSIT